MIVDARTVASDITIDTDVCIVGGGVAGLTLAREFIGKQVRVCVLESGGFEPDSETQALCEGENVGLPYFPLDTARSRNLGGSSYRWLLEIGHNRMGARLRPLDEIDFEKRDWVPHSGWPFNKAHLDPYYTRAQSILEVGPYSYEVDDWEDSQRTPRLPLRADRVKTVVFQCCSRDVFLSRSRDMVEHASDITVLLHATVVEIEALSVPRRISGVRVACLNGKRFRVSANVFILALGGIETPRLLLLSNKVHSYGMGNQNDLVGRFFMEHLHLASGLLIPSKLLSSHSANCYQVHRSKDIPIQGALTLSEQMLQRERLLSYGVMLSPVPYATIRGSALGSANALVSMASSLTRGDLDEFNRQLSMLFPVIGDFSIALFRKGMKLVRAIHGLRKVKLFRLSQITEQMPNPESRVTLDDSRDALGFRRVRLNWLVTQQDMRSIIRAQEILDKEFRYAGLGNVHIELASDRPPPDLKGGWHHMGTTRMHVDPRQGVVDEHCCVHGIANLYIAGPSVFPTGGYANPTLTVVALAVRLADHVKEVLRHSHVAA